MSNVSFCYNTFKSHLLQMRQKASVCVKILVFKLPKVDFRVTLYNVIEGKDIWRWHLWTNALPFLFFTNHKKEAATSNSWWIIFPLNSVNLVIYITGKKYTQSNFNQIFLTHAFYKLLSTWNDSDEKAYLYKLIWAYTVKKCQSVQMDVFNWSVIHLKPSQLLRSIPY